ncbi:MAG: hypothetical protein SNG02_06025 [Rikenellaceae bacterium]
MRAKFNSFVTQIEEKHSDFRNSINAKYADFIRETWTKHAPEAPIPTPSKPEPPEQPIYVPAPQEPDKPEPKPQPIPIDDVVTIPQPEEKPQPVEPIVEPKRPITVSIEVDFFGRKCQISLDKSAPLTLSNNNEEGVASAWEELSKDKYNTMLNECLALRDELKLCDWAYIQLAQAVTREQYGSDKCDAAIVTQAYILVQSGYKVRMGRVGGNLTLLLPSSEPIYGMTYINLKGQKYYVLCEVGDEDTIGLCDASFPNEKIFSLYVSEQPMLPMHQVEERVFRSVKLGGDGITLAVNRNLMNFYGTYPNCEWNIHAMASLSDEIKEQLYAYLRPAIEGKNAEAAANILINFVQTGFSYKTDEEQFGYERPLFGDETFFYPYSDCEDRAILFSILIRDLMGLDVVLLNYPEHLATAVHFKDDIQGDYIELNDKKYLVCDPTYINAEIGLTMPDMYGQQVRIIQL